MPVLNFMDTRSLLTWLETRKLILEMGERFQVRIQLYTSYYILVCAASLLFIFAVMSGIVESDILTIEQWISFKIYTAFLLISCLIIMLPTAYLNKEIQI